MTTLADLVSSNTATISASLTQAITQAPGKHANELLDQLDQIWRKDRADLDRYDRVWLDAVAALPCDLLTEFQDRARRAGRYLAARCLAYHAAGYHLTA